MGSGGGCELGSPATRPYLCLGLRRSGSFGVSTSSVTARSTLPAQKRHKSAACTAMDSYAELGTEKELICDTNPVGSARGEGKGRDVGQRAL
jgi:hypothetical protein